MVSNFIQLFLWALYIQISWIHVHMREKCPEMWLYMEQLLPNRVHIIRYLCVFVDERNICPPNMKIQNIKMREIHSIISGSFHFMFSHFVSFGCAPQHITFTKFPFGYSVSDGVWNGMKWRYCCRIIYGQK